MLNELAHPAAVNGTNHQIPSVLPYRQVASIPAYQWHRFIGTVRRQRQQRCLLDKLSIINLNDLKAHWCWLVWLVSVEQISSRNWPVYSQSSRELITFHKYSAIVTSFFRKTLHWRSTQSFEEDDFIKRQRQPKSKRTRTVVKTHNSHNTSTINKKPTDGP